MDQKNIYFIYARKSSEGEDRQMLSIDGQLNDLKKVIEQNELTVIDTYTESKSAHIPDNRPMFNDMVKRIIKGQANGIICWHINRLSRNPKESGEIQQLLQDGKIISIITPYKQYKTEDNALLFSIETSEANQYSRDLSRNVKRGLQQKIEMGQPPGQAPLGYLNTKSSLHGSNTIIVDPLRWPLIRKGYNMLLTGAYTVSQIVVILNNDYGLRTRPGKILGNKPVGRSTFYRIFTDPFYYGYFLRKGTLYKGAYQAMITVDEYDKVQDILGRKGKPRPKRHLFAYTGLIKCGECGASITATRKLKQLKSTGELKAYTFYHCTNQKADVKCPGYYIRESDMDEMIITELSKYQLRPSFKELAIEFIKENQQNELNKFDEVVNIQNQAEAKLQGELNELLEMRISLEITPQVYSDKKLEKETKLLRIKEKNEQLKNESKNWIIEFEDKLAFATKLVEKFMDGTINTRKEICHRFGWNWILKDKKLFIDKQEWLISIKKYAEEAESFFGVLEPEIDYGNKGWFSSFECMRPVLLGLIEDVRTFSSDYTNTCKDKQKIRETSITLYK